MVVLLDKPKNWDIKVPPLMINFSRIGVLDRRAKKPLKHEILQYHLCGNLFFVGDTLYH
jgi:hypothetical protein